MTPLDTARFTSGMTRGDPDVSGVAIEVSQRGCMRCDQDYVTVDGLTFKYGISPEGGFRSEGATGLTVQNCNASYNMMNGISIKLHNCVIDNCTATYNYGHNLVAGGTGANPATSCTIKNSTASNGQTMTWVGVSPQDGYGIKFLFVTDGFIYGNTVNGNAADGINFDGTTTQGCEDCQVYENKVYDNAFRGIFIEYSPRAKVYRNLVYDNSTTGGSNSYEIGVVGGSRDTEVYNNLVYLTKATGNTSSVLMHVSSYGPLTLTEGCKVYNNTCDADGHVKTVMWVSSFSTGVDLKIKNNILVNGTDRCIWLDCTDYTGFEFDYNQMVRSDANTDVITRAYTGYTTAEYFAAFADGENNATGAAGFTDQAAQDYTLAAGSDCLEAGVDLGSAYDDGLDPTSVWPAAVVTADQDAYGSGWEIGAFVYTAAGAGGGGGVGLVLDVDSNGKPILYEGVTARITGSNADVTDGDDVQVVRDGTDASLYVNGTQIGATYTSLAIAEGTVAELTAMAEGCKAIEFWKLYTAMDLN